MRCQSVIYSCRPKAALGLCAPWFCGGLLWRGSKRLHNILSKHGSWLWDGTVCFLSRIIPELRVINKGGLSSLLHHQMEPSVSNILITHGAMLFVQSYGSWRDASWQGPNERPVHIECVSAERKEYKCMQVASNSLHN